MQYIPAESNINKARLNNSDVPFYRVEYMFIIIVATKLPTNPIGERFSATYKKREFQDFRNVPATFFVQKQPFNAFACPHFSKYHLLCFE